MLILRTKPVDEAVMLPYVARLWELRYMWDYEEALAEVAAQELIMWRRYDHMAKTALEPLVQKLGETQLTLRATILGVETTDRTAMDDLWNPLWENLVVYGERYIFVMKEDYYGESEVVPDDHREGFPCNITWRAIPLPGVPYAPGEHWGLGDAANDNDT